MQLLISIRQEVQCFYHLVGCYKLFWIFSYHANACCWTPTIIFCYLFSLKPFISLRPCQCPFGDRMSEQQDSTSKSSSSSISSSTQESEEEVSITIGSLLAQAKNNSGHSLGRRLSQLGSIPVIYSHPYFSLFPPWHLFPWTHLELYHD